MNVIASKIWSGSNRTEIVFNEKKTTLTSLLLTMVDWINEKINVSDKVWKLVHQKYGTSQIIWKPKSIKTNNWSYLDVTDNGWLNQWNNEYERREMNVSALKIWNESKHTNFSLNWNKQLLLPLCYQRWLIESTKKWMWLIKYECECIKKRNESNRTNFIQLKQTTALTPLLLTMEIKQWLWVIKYEWEWI